MCDQGEIWRTVVVVVEMVMMRGGGWTLTRALGGVLVVKHEGAALELVELALAVRVELVEPPQRMAGLAVAVPDLGVPWV